MTNLLALDGHFVIFTTTKAPQQVPGANRFRSMYAIAD